ncbi:MAG TPA: hypothetical protein VFU21_03355, partial [Kofleriaceae bacterium]|nr:hypothetical protein [Kofleriaceae bacterium]
MRVVIVTIAVLAGTFAVKPAGTAHAWYYCGGHLTPAWSWCQGPYHEGIHRNRALYPGSGTVGVGIIFYRNFTGAWLYEAYANNYVVRDWLCPIAGVPYVKNNSGHRHTIEGHFRWSSGLCAFAPDPANRLDAVRDELAAMDGTTHGSLAVLRAGGAVELSATTQNAAQAAIDDGFLVDAGAARLARVEANGDQYIVAPGTDTCLFRQAADGTEVTCSSPEQIAAGESIVVTAGTDDLAAGQIRIAGLAPDGAVAARVQLSEGGAAIEVPVVNNVFVTETAGEAAQVPLE